jgi:hypothetical protein
MADLHPAEHFLRGTQSLIDAHLRPQGQDALVRLSNYLTDPDKAAQAVKQFSSYDVEGFGHISPKDFLKYITEIPLEKPVTMEEGVLLVKDLDTHSDGRIFWSALAKSIQLASARQVSLANMDNETSLRPIDVGLDKTHWRDPNRQQQHWSINDMSKNAVQFKYASLKALQAPLDEVDRAFISQFISMMRRDGMKIRKHGSRSINKRTIRINNKVTHILWNSKRTQMSKNSRAAVIALVDVTEVARGAFPGSVAMPMGMVKRCISVISPKRTINLECEYEEDADLLFAGLAILTLGRASKKMQDQRKKVKDKKKEQDLMKHFNQESVTGLEGTLLRLQAENGTLPDGM